MKYNILRAWVEIEKEDEKAKETVSHETVSTAKEDILTDEIEKPIETKTVETSIEEKEKEGAENG